MCMWCFEHLAKLEGEREGGGGGKKPGAPGRQTRRGRQAQPPNARGQVSTWCTICRLGIRILLMNARHELVLHPKRFSFPLYGTNGAAVLTGAIYSSLALLPLSYPLRLINFGYRACCDCLFG